MHQIRIRLGLCPRPHWGAYSAPQTPWLDLRGPTSEGRGGKRRGVRGEGGERRGAKRGGRRREGRGGLSGNVAKEAFCLKSAPAPLLTIKQMPVSENWLSSVRAVVPVKYRQSEINLHTLHNCNTRFRDAKDPGFWVRVRFGSRRNWKHVSVLVIVIVSIQAN